MKKLIFILGLTVLFLTPFVSSAQWVNLPNYKLQKTVDGLNYQLVYTNSGGGGVRFYQKAQIDSMRTSNNPSSAILRGISQTTLVAGTKAVTITGVTTSSKAIVTLVTPNTTTLTVNYQAVCTSGTVTITALVAAGTINTADLSTVNVIVYN